MIELLMLLAWLIPAFAVYRRLGWSYNSKLMKGHEYQLICRVCKCKHCREPKEYHPINGRTRSFMISGCENYEPRRSAHPSALYGMIPLALLGWPVVLGIFGCRALQKHYGIEAVALFKPPPNIESKDEKFERRNKELEAEKAETDKRLKELGINL